MSQSNLKPIEKWWGQQHFELNESKIWQLGSLIVRLTRTSNEWRLDYHRPTVQYDYEQQFNPIDDPFFELPQPIKTERYMFQNTESSLYLMPRLSPRSIVIKPIQPVYIPAGQSTMLYISTPLWIRGFIQRPENALFELPVIRPKETWFGKNKQRGELCYATSVDGRTHLESLTPRAFRAMTSVSVHNQSQQQFHFERINVPVMALPLFYSASAGRLLTSQIRVHYEGRDRIPKVRIEQGSPSFIHDAETIHLAHETSTLFNMFDSLF